MTSSRLALAVALVTGLLLTPSPLFGVHGVESALVLGIVLPPFVAAAGARRVLWARRRGLGRRAGEHLAGAVGIALAAFALAVLVLALNALRVRNCTPGQGLLFMLLGPAPGLVLAAVTGVAFGAAVRRPSVATVLAVLAPIAGMAVGVWRFHATPAISLFGHFHGWFPGTIYDEAIEVPVELATFRGVTTLLTGGLALAVVALWDRGAQRLRLARARPAPLITALGLLAAVIAAAVFAPELGHRSSVAHVVEELGATEQGARCIVHAPREMDRRELRRHVADCDFRVAQAERALGVRQRAPVVAYLFRNPEEKRRLMGASGTHIAKPWRNEVFLHRHPWPHPVLAHEVAHVVAGRAARGPWHVSGSLGGWLPNPGLIEGVAVAAAWQPRQGLTPHQWAHAMAELDRMPSLEGIAGLGFMLQPGARAYTAAGSFVRWLGDQHGPEVVREAYRTGDVAAAAGAPLDVLERRWRRFLQDVPLPPDALALAALRFEGGTIFSIECPRELARLRQRMGEDRAAGDTRRLRRTCGEILSIDPADTRARAALVGALARLGRTDEARSELARLTSRYDAPPPVEVGAREGLADAAWQRGEVDLARSAYRALLDEPQTEDAARALEVKALALDADPAQAALAFELLVGESGRGASPPVAVHLARELDALRSDGVGEYLEARQLFFKRRFERSQQLLRAALEQGLPTGRLTREARRLLGTSLYGAGRLEAAERFWREQRDRARTPADRALADEWLARLAR